MNEENMNILLDEIKNIRIHQLLRVESSLSKQFSFLIFKKDDSIYINIFQKEYNPYKNDKWTKRGKYKISIILNNEIHLHEPYDWYDVEDDYELLDLDTNPDASIEQHNLNIEIDDINDINEEAALAIEEEAVLAIEEAALAIEEEAALSIEEEALAIEEEAALAIEEEAALAIEEEEVNEVNEDDLMLSLTDIFYDTYYHERSSNDIDVDEIYEFIDYDLYNILYDNMNGLHFNSNDIRWQIAIKELLSSYIGNSGENIKYFNYKNYSKKCLDETYYKNYNKNSVYEKYIYNNTKIVCDLCNYNIETTEFYHNPECGDLCDKCYIVKKTTDINKIKKYWKIVFNEGKKVMFNKELKGTLDYLESNPVKELPIEKKYTIVKNVASMLIKSRKRPCSICLNHMHDDLYSGKCGHCFHKDCIESWTQLDCPVCRMQTHFIKLYI